MMSKSDSLLVVLLIVLSSALNAGEFRVNGEVLGDSSLIKYITANYEARVIKIVTNGNVSFSRIDETLDEPGTQQQRLVVDDVVIGSSDLITWFLLNPNNDNVRLKTNGNLRIVVEPPDGQPVISQFMASQASVTAGDEITLTWQSSGADYCIAKGDFILSGELNPSDSYTFTENRVGVRNYKLSCETEIGGQILADSLTVSVTVASSGSMQGLFSNFIGADILGVLWSNELAYNLAGLVDAKITTLGAEKVYWQHLEPSVDSGIQWQEFDALLSNVQQVGGNITPTIWSVSSWATRVADEQAPSSAPTTIFENRYKDFIRSFVERYDADGVDDMQGILRPIEYLQIEDEAQNLGDSWNESSSCDFLTQTALYECAANEYGQMLKLAYAAAHEADADIKVVSFSFNPGDYFDNNTEQSPVVAERLVFLETVYTNFNQYFDVIGIQCNYDYTGIPAWVAYIKERYQLNKEIICTDAASMPMVGKHQYYGQRYIDQYPFMDDTEILTILSQGSDHPDYGEIKNWWEESRAKISIKKAVVSLAEGVGFINFQFVMAFSRTLNAWDYSGLSSGGLAEQEDGPIGTPRAVLHALSQLNELFANFETIENLNPINGGNDPYSWNWLYRLSNSDGDEAYIFWNDSNGEIDFSPYLSIPEQVVKEFIVEIDQQYAPIILERLSDSYLIETTSTPQFLLVEM